MRTAAKRILSLVLVMSILGGMISTPLSTVSWAKAAEDTKVRTADGLEQLGDLLGAEIKTVGDSRYLVVSSRELTAGDILSAAQGGRQITLRDPAGSDVPAASPVATGMELTLTEAGRTETARLVVLGDVNGDGRLDTADTAMVQAHIMESAPLVDTAAVLAADVNGDGRLSALDYVRMGNMIAYAGVTITLHFNETDLADRTARLGERVLLPAAEKAGYTFAGWYIRELDRYLEGTEVAYWNYTHASETLNLVPIFTSPEETEDGMTVTAGQEHLQFCLGGLGRPGKVYFIYALDAAQYYYTETATGQFRNETDSFEAGGRQNVVTEGTQIGWYLGGSDYRFSAPRYDAQGYDNIYKKYYVVSGDDVAKGPVWVNDFTDRLGCNDYAYAAGALLDDFDPLKDPANSKKGVCDALGEDLAAYYGSAYVPIDMRLIGYVSDGRGGYRTAGLVAPNEIVNEETGEITRRGYDTYHDRSIRPGEDEADVTKTVDRYPYLEFESNGSYYYFNRQVLSQIDNSVVAAYHSNLYSIAILTVPMYEDQEVLPYYMQYPGMAEFVANKTDPKANATFQQVNTANQTGADYWIALMEFFAWRYTELGLIDIVLGNEVDFAGAWNVTADYTTTTVTVEQYAEELYRALRLASLAFGKYTDKLDMSLSFTHYWNANGAEGGIYTYQPRQIMDLVLEKSNAQGNFRWGMIIHNYGYNLSANNVFKGDINSQMVDGNFNTTKCITITNLEVLEQYLEQDHARVNGQLRPVYLTETGINTGKDNTEAQQQRQAAAIIYHYYKVQMLDAVVCWPYYRMADIEAEALHFGLLQDAEHPRLASAVWADLGRLSIDEINDKYKHYLQAGIGYFDENDDYATILQKVADLLGVDYDWNAAWEKYYGHTVRGNRFTVAPADITTPYTGEAIRPDTARAYKGTVQYKFFDAEGNPVDTVREAGDYRYVAYVNGTDSYDGIESQPLALRVTRAENGLIYPVVDGRIYFNAGDGPIDLPRSVTRFGAPAFTVTDGSGQTVTRLTCGVYTLTVDAVAETANYTGLPAAVYTIEVTAPNAVSTYAELTAALNAYYENPVPSTVINLTANIDCGNALWNVDDRGQPFCAVFNGNGYTVSNLQLGSVGDSRIGFFARLGDGAVVRDLTLRNVRTALYYPENDTAYTDPVSVGVLAAEVTGTRVQVSGVTVEDACVEVTNRSAAVHQMQIGGLFGADRHTTAADAGASLRSRLTVRNFRADVTENAYHLWMGGIAGTLEGAAPTADADSSMAVYDTCTVAGGSMTMYAPAGTEEAAMGAYFGRLNNYTDITLRGVCSADPRLVRRDARVVTLDASGITDQPMPDPMQSGSYARYMPSSFHVVDPVAGNLLGWVGMQTHISGRYYEPAPGQQTVGDSVYTRSTFHIGSKVTCKAEMSAETFADKTLTVSDAQLARGYDLTENTLYVGDTETDITFFRSPNIRVSSFAGTWSVERDAYDLLQPGFMYAPTCNIAGAGAANCMGYWYNPDWPGGGGESGWCLPYQPGGAVYTDPDALGYTVRTLTEADFGDLDEITLYGLVTAKNGDPCWYDVVRLTVTRSAPKKDTGTVLFLGDSVCASVQYGANVQGILDNYVVNPYEKANALAGGWVHSGGWAYLYALEHPGEMVWNYGVGGATMGEFGREEGTTLPEEYAAFRAAAPDADVRLAVVEMTLNDLMVTSTSAGGYGRDVLSLSDLTRPVPDHLAGTSLGAMVGLIQQIRADYPNADLVVMTPPERYDELYAFKDAYGSQLYTVMDDVSTICRRLQVPVIDLWDKSGLKCSVDNGATWDTALYNAREGIHPSMLAYVQHLYPCMMAFVEGGDDSVLRFPCDWLEKETVVFTRPPQPMEAVYTGAALTFTPDAAASFGQVTYRYFDSEKQPVTAITDAGSYFYKAYVKGDRTHKDLESDYVAITVWPADNSFTAQPQPIRVTYTGAPADIQPAAAARYGQVVYTYYLADRTSVIDKAEILLPGTYYYKAAVAAANNYRRLESDFVAITVDKLENSLTALPQPITVTYTGAPADIQPVAAALYGQVRYVFYMADRTSVIDKSDIVSAGTYYYKAVVDSGDTYAGIESDFVSITVAQAENGLCFPVREGVIELPCTEGGRLPAFVRFGAPEVTVTAPDGRVLAPDEPVEMNTVYTLTLGPVAETADYTAFAGGTYTLSVIGARAENRFTADPAPIEKVYDGTCGGIEPAAAALHGQVVYTYYLADRTSIIDKTAIVDAGTYYYRAAVEQSNTYEGVDSGLVAITVHPAENGLLDGWTAVDGVIRRDYTPEGTLLPAALTRETAGVTFTVTDGTGHAVQRLAMGDYTLTFTGTANYTGLEAQYTIHVDDQVSVADFAELTAALRSYYANPSSHAVLTLADDIDCGGAEWTQMGEGAFTGTFDGGRHTITGLRITDTSKQSIGFFAVLGDGAIIRDLTLKGAAIDLSYPKGDTAYGGETAVGVLAGRVTGTRVKISRVTVDGATVTVRNESAVDHEMAIGGLLGVDHYTTDDHLDSYLRRDITIRDLNVTVSENARRIGVGGIMGVLSGASPVRGRAGSSVAVYENCIVNEDGKGKLELYDPAGTVGRGMGAYAGRLHNYTDVKLRGCAAAIPLRLLDARITVHDGEKLVDWIMPELMTHVYTNFVSYYPSSFNPTGDSVWLGWFGLQDGCENRYWEQTTGTADYSVSDITSSNSACTTVMKTLSQTPAGTITITAEQLQGGYALETHSNYIGGTATDVVYYRAPYIQTVQVPGVWNVGSKTRSTLNAKLPVFGGMGLGYWYVPGTMPEGACGWVNLHGGLIWFDPTDPALDLATTVLTEADFADTDTVKLYGYVTLHPDDPAQQVWGYHYMQELTVKLEKQANRFTVEPSDLEGVYTGAALTFTTDAAALYGQVSCRYYDADKKEIPAITEAGTYYYKAIVAAGSTYAGLESDFAVITVHPAENAFTTAPRPVTTVYTGGPLADPPVAARFGQVSFVYYDAEGNALGGRADVVNAGTYAYEAIVAGSTNYTALTSERQTITILPADNRFTTPPQPIQVTYTGSPAVFEPQAAAQNGGDVTFIYYAADQTTELSGREEIVEGGTYYYKAVVEADANHNRLESDFVSITVTPAENGLRIEPTDGVIRITYADGGRLPAFVRYGTPEVTVTAPDGRVLAPDEPVEMNKTYTLTLGPVAETASYTAFAGGTYTLSVIGDRLSNAFTTEPAAITLTYGEALAVDVRAQLGDVTITYYDAERQEIEASDIVDAGTYYYRAVVAQSNTYEGLDSGYLTITVEPAANRFLAGYAPNSEGVILVGYDSVNRSCTILPQTLTVRQDGLTSTLWAADGQPVGSRILEMGETYTLTFTGTGNYTGIADRYTVRYGIAGYGDLVQAMQDYSAAPAELPRLTLIDDIDCAGTWTPVTAGFAGTLDGGGHTITGLRITDTSKQNIGFFSELLDGAEICDLTFDSAVIDLLYPDGDTAYTKSTTVGVLAGKVSNTKVRICNVTVDGATVTVRNYSDKNHQMEIGGLVGVDRRVAVANEASYRREGIRILDLCVEVTENAQNLFLGGIAGSLVGNSKVQAGKHPATYINCHVEGGMLRMYDPVGGVNRVMGAYFGRLNNYVDLTLQDCTADIDLTMVDARVVVNAGGTFTDWVMPDAAYGDSAASYLPSNYNRVVDGVSLMGWIGTQSGASNRYWEGSNSAITSSIILQNAECTSRMRTESVVQQTLALHRSDLAGGYALETLTPYAGAVATDTLYFRQPLMVERPILASMEATTGTVGTINTWTPVAIVADAPYQIAYWHMDPGANYVNDYTLGWNLFHGANNQVVYFDPVTFGYATRTLTEADFAGTDTITLYGLVTAPDADASNWGWKKVIELTVTLVD